MRLSRPTLAASLLGALFCAAPVARPEVPPAAADPRPTLLVFITVDQMREDYLARWGGGRQFTGGFRRLLDRGAFFTNGHQDHAITETAPGHASVMSGRFPRSTGITRNLAGVNDPNSPLIGAPGPGASPFRFRGTTLTDWLTAADGRTRALSVSYKDRGAILPIGRSKQQVYWYSSAGVFTTSRWYRDTLPDWVNAFNARGLPRGSAGRVWYLVLPASEYAEPDSVPVEAQGRGFLFPHRLSANPDTAAIQLPNFPFLDEITAAMALDGVRALGLGRGPQTDILAVSFSATDLVGHRYGPDSREIHDQVVRLDRIIGGLLDSLYRMRDSTRVIVALTGDHGVYPFPELNNGRITPAPLRVNVRPAIEAAQRVILVAGGNPKAVEFESGAFLVDHDSVRVSRDVLRAAVDSLLTVARRIPGVLRANRLGDLAKADLGRDYVARRWVQMFPPDAPVEAVITLTPGSYWWYYPVAQHGTPHDEDTHVPIIFMGSSFKPGRYSEFARTVDMGPTLAQVLGVTPLEPLDGRVLKAGIK